MIKSSEVSQPPLTAVSSIVVSMKNTFAAAQILQGLRVRFKSHVTKLYSISMESGNKNFVTYVIYKVSFNILPKFVIWIAFASSKFTVSAIVHQTVLYYVLRTT